MLLRAFALAATTLLVLTSPARAITVDTFTLPASVPYPRGIVLGSDGNLWISSSSQSKLFRMRPSGVIDRTLDVAAATGIDRGLNNLIAGPDGALWMTRGRRVNDAETTEILRVPIEGQPTVFPLRTPTVRPDSLAFGPDGNLWFAQNNTKPALGRMTPDGLVTEFTGQVTAPRVLAAGADGRIWFGGWDEFGVSSTAGLIEPIPFDGSVLSMVPAPDAAARVWVGGYDPGYWIGRVDLATGKMAVFDAGTVYPAVMTTAADGNIWFGGSYGRVGRINPAGRIKEFDQGLDPQHLVVAGTAGLGRTVWFLTTGFIPSDTYKAVRITLAGPDVGAWEASEIGPRSGTLAAVVNPNGVLTTVRFEYGESTAYGRSTGSIDVGDADTGAVATARIGDLEPGRTLHYRAVATNRIGTAAGPDRTFTTALDPPPPLVPAPVIADPDADGDGHPASVDCDDRAARTHVGARETPGDGIDQDCSGADAAFTRFFPRIVANWDSFRTATYKFSTFNALHVEQVPAGTRVELTCKGKGCRFSRWSTTIKKAKRKLVLLPRMKGSPLRRGSRVELRLIRADQIGTLMRWKVGPPPKPSTRCLVPGGRKERRC